MARVKLANDRHLQLVYNAIKTRSMDYGLASGIGSIVGTTRLEELVVESCCSQLESRNLVVRINGVPTHPLWLLASSAPVVDSSDAKSHRSDSPGPRTNRPSRDAASHSSGSSGS